MALGAEYAGEIRNMTIRLRCEPMAFLSATRWRSWIGLLAFSIGLTVLQVDSFHDQHALETRQPVHVFARAAAPRYQTVHLNRYFHFTRLMRDPAVEAELVRYESNYDHTEQTLLIMRPRAYPSEHLFFFLHGMDGDSGDGVVIRDLVASVHATVVSLGGRGPSWVSDAFLADSEQVITEYSKGGQGYYLIGISMGGTQALSLAGLLPDDLRHSLLGLIALIPGADLPAIAKRSTNDRVRDTLLASVSANLAQLRERSPHQLLDAYRPGLPLVILYNDADTLLLTDELMDFVASLHDNGHPVSTFVEPGEHAFLYSHLDYETVFETLGRDSAARQPPPILENVR